MDTEDTRITDKSPGRLEGVFYWQMLLFKSTRDAYPVGSESRVYYERVCENFQKTIDLIKEGERVYNDAKQRTSTRIGRSYSNEYNIPEELRAGLAALHGLSNRQEARHREQTNALVQVRDVTHLAIPAISLDVVTAISQRLQKTDTQKWILVHDGKLTNYE